MQPLPQFYFSRILRCLIEFEMLADGDRLLIGLSGGKDSLFLTYALAMMRRHLPISFDLAAFTLDPGFAPNFPLEKLAQFCRQLDIPFYSERAEIWQIIQEQDQKDACFTCSYFRRGIVNRIAAEHGYNKVAYAHHQDDAVETFFMSQLFSGQLKTFSPVTHLEKSGITVIRPLLYLREQEIKGTHTLFGLEPIESPCPLNGKTRRQTIKELIANLRQLDPEVYEHLLAAMRQQEEMALWPAKRSRDEMKQLHDKFWLL